MRHPKRLSSAALLVMLTLLGMLTLLLTSCGSSGAGLIPSESAGPLQGDFEAVARAAQAGDGNCARTEAAIRRTQQNFQALPAIDSGLHKRLDEGIVNLSNRALALCAEPLPSATTTTSNSRTSSTSTSTATTKTTTVSPTETITTSTSTLTTSAPGGGALAPSEPTEEGPAGQTNLEGTSHNGEAGGTGGTGQGVEQ